MAVTDKASYETGYENGESSMEANYDFWFHDQLALPDSWSTEECKDFVVSIVDRFVDWNTLPDSFPFPKLVDEPPVQRVTEEWQVKCGVCHVSMYPTHPSKVIDWITDHTVQNGHNAWEITKRKN